MSDGSLINLGQLTEPITALINKIGDATGVLYEPRQMRRLARAQVDAERTLALGRAETMDLLEQRASRRVHVEAIRQQQNIEAVIAGALPDIKTEARPQFMNDDWVAHVLEKARVVSDEDMQTLWSRILAGEANAPGSFSRQTIEIVAALDKADAELFTAFCGATCVVGKSPRPVVFSYRQPYLERVGLTFHSISHLEELGLVAKAEAGLEPGFNFVDLEKGSKWIIKHGSAARVITTHTGKLPFGLVKFTRAGEQLYPFAGSLALSGHLEFIEEHLRAKGYVVNPAKEGPRPDTWVEVVEGVEG